jgi:multimeric flavodoxin WrbA
MPAAALRPIIYIMKKVVAIVGCANKRYTHRAVRQFLENLQAFGDVESEVVSLGSLSLKPCRGCQLCFDKGEEFCPLRDDRDALFGKIEAADGVVLATPNYSFQVSGLTKMFLDRLGFAMHRPRYFGKAFSSITCQGFFGGGKIVKYLNFVGYGLGFNTVKGACLKTLHPIPQKVQRKNDAALDRLAKRFHEKLARPFPAPGLAKLFLFSWSRMSMKLLRGAGNRDYDYYSDKGWLQSDYFYPVRLGAVKKAVGGFFDSVAGRLARSQAA